MGPLSPREMRVVRAGLVLAVVFALVQFVYLPAHDLRKDLEGTLAAESQSLARIRELAREYRSLSPEGPAMAAAEKGFSLFSFLDRGAAKSGIKDAVEYMKPHVKEIENSPYSLSIVRLKLNGAVFRAFLGFVKEVESSDQDIRITSLTLNPEGKEEKRLEATMEIQVLVPREDG